jgi:site-specific recombinase XerD
MALKNGADLYYVQQALRHRSITTSELYLKPIEREEKAAEKFIKI